MSPALLMLALGACGPSTKKVVLTSLETLSDERANIGALAGSPELQEAARKLSQAVVDGGLDAVSSEERARQLQAHSEALVAALGPVLAQSIQQDLGPAVRGELQKAVYQAVVQATSGPIQGRVERMAAGVSQSVAEVLIPQVGPAVGDSLRRDILPALEDSLRRTILETDQNLVRTAVNEAMLGLADALEGKLGDAISDRTKKSTEIIVAELDKRSGWWQNVAYGLGFGMFGIVGLATWSIHIRRKRTELVENTLLMVMETIKDHETDPGILETVQGIRKKGRGQGTGDVLKEMLKKRPELRVEPDPTPAESP